MLGAIAGDIIGSVHEFGCGKTKDFPLFVADSRYTDDSVHTVAVADWLLTGKDLTDSLIERTRAHPGRGYGSMFFQWAHSGQREAYGSYGNGSAMRVSPVGFAFDDLDEVLARAELSAAVTHNHPEGVRGAQATAVAIYWARRTQGREVIRNEIERSFGYDLHRTLDEIRPHYQFSETCWGTVPQALIAFLESTNFEDAIRNAISLGGDADTLACIAGGVAEAYYGGVPPEIDRQVRERLDPALLEVVDRFGDKFGRPSSHR